MKYLKKRKKNYQSRVRVRGNNDSKNKTNKKLELLRKKN